MKGVALFLVGTLLGVSAIAEQSQSNELPKVAAQALASPDSVILYSLEPYTENPEADRNWKGAKFHGYNCLGQLPLTGLEEQTAISEFKKAIPKDRQPMANCFDPRHALRVVSGGHTYDFLLCFQCAQLEVAEDDKELAVLCASGSADVLNGILKKAGIPVSYVFSEAYIKEQQDELAKRKSDWNRWLSAAPRSQIPFLKKAYATDPGSFSMDVFISNQFVASTQVPQAPDPAEHKSELDALSQDIPDENKRILALLEWYGSDGGPWTGYASYEQFPEKLLLTFPKEKIISAAGSATLTDRQTEGAARILTVIYYQQGQSDGLKLLPEMLKKKFLDHALESKDDDKITRVKAAFGGGNPPPH